MILERTNCVKNTSNPFKDHLESCEKIPLKDFVVLNDQEVGNEDANGAHAQVQMPIFRSHAKMHL